MAKKKEEPLFVEPEFDERSFIRDEKERAKSAIVIFVIGALIGLLSGYLSIIGLWYFSVLLIFVFLLFLRIILNALGLEIPKKTTHKIILGGEFILTWLIFWILFLNPPLHVVSGPQISDLQMQTSSGSFTPVTEPKANIYNLPATTHSVRLYVNYKYPITSITITEAPKGSPSSTTTLSSHYTGNYVYFNLSSNVGTTELITAHAQSTKASNSYTFTVNFVKASSSLQVEGMPQLLRAGVV